MKDKNKNISKRLNNYKVFCVVVFNLFFAVVTTFLALYDFTFIKVGLNTKFETEEKQIEYIASLVGINVGLLVLILLWVLVIKLLCLSIDYRIAMHNNISSIEESNYEIKRYLISMNSQGNGPSNAVRYKPYSINESIYILKTAIEDFDDPIRALDYLQTKNNEVEGKDPYLSEVIFALKSSSLDNAFDSLERYSEQLVDQAKKQNKNSKK